MSMRHIHFKTKTRGGKTDEVKINPLSDISQFAVAKHSKGTVEGEKTERSNHYKLRISKFETLSTLDAVLVHLFGDLDPV